MKKELEEYLNTHIPITIALGVKVQIATITHVVLFAPFSNNINHKKTVFGGSLHSLATLACWSLLYLNLKDTPYEIVITKSDIVYSAPVDTDFTVECKSPENSEWQRFTKMLSLKNKARIQLSAKIYHKERLSVDYQATFAALKLKTVQPDGPLL